MKKYTEISRQRIAYDRSLRYLARARHLYMRQAYPLLVSDIPAAEKNKIIKHMAKRMLNNGLYTKPSQNINSVCHNIVSRTHRIWQANSQREWVENNYDVVDESCYSKWDRFNWPTFFNHFHYNTKESMFYEPVKEEAA